MQSILASTLASERSRRGSRGALGELRTKIGVTTTDPLAHLTLQQRRLAFIRRERPLAYAMLVGFWPMDQAAELTTGNDPLRARLLDRFSRWLQEDRDIPDREDMAPFGATSGLDDDLEYNLQHSEQRLRIDMDGGADIGRDDVERWVSEAVDSAIKQATNSELGRDHDGWAADQDRDGWWWTYLYEYHDIDGCQDNIEWTTSGPRIELQMSLEGVPGGDDPSLVLVPSVEMVCTSSRRPPDKLDWIWTLRVEDRHNALPPCLKRWIEKHGDDPEELHELVCALADIRGWARKKLTIDDALLPLVTQADYDWAIGCGRTDDTQLRLFSKDSLGTDWLIDRIEEEIEHQGTLDNLAHMLACLEKTKEHELLPRAAYMRSAIEMMFDWRFAHRNENLEDMSLHNALVATLSSHEDGIVQEETDRIVDELGLEGKSEQLEQLAEEQQIDQAIFVDGAKIVELFGTDALRMETRLMRHCIGQTIHGHPQMLEQGKTRVFSYRDPTGKPRATWEMFSTTMATSDLQGPVNGPIHDVDAKRRMLWFLWSIRHAPMGAGNDFGHTDVVKLRIVPGEPTWDTEGIIAAVPGEIRWSNGPEFDRYEPEGHEE